MEFLARENPVDGRNVGIHLRVHVHERDGLAEVRPPGMHEVEAQTGMANQDIFQKQRVAEAGAEFRREFVGRARWAGAG